MNRIAVVVATSGGAGYAPFAPGTVGSAVGVAVFLLLRDASIGWQVSVTAVVTVVGIWAASVAERHFAREDPGPVVIDEVAGQLVTLAATGASVAGIAAGFFLFRLFDVIKPFPVNRFERLPRGYGIMADDVMAGVYGHLVLRLLIWQFPGTF
jgi:phosphatidylglycerophosphatase A